MAKIIKANQFVDELRPSNGVNFTSSELQYHVQGIAETIFLIMDGQEVFFSQKIMVYNELGDKLGLPLNNKAQDVYQLYFNKAKNIYGDILICDPGEVVLDSY